MNEEQRLHRELLDAFYKYIKYNLNFELRESKTSVVDIRRELFRIRNLAKKRGDILLGINKAKGKKSKTQKQKDNDNN
jgi:hypothetical protein